MLEGTFFEWLDMLCIAIYLEYSEVFDGRLIYAG